MGTSFSFMNSFMSSLRSVGASESGDKVTITGLPYKSFLDFLYKKYKVRNFMDKFAYKAALGGIVIHKFFVPEFVYLVQQAAEGKFISANKANAIIDSIFANTWFGSATKDFPTEVDVSRLSKYINPNFKPTKVQLEFIKDVYWQKKSQMHLRGYLVALEPGMGKSKLSLFLACGLRKKHVIVVAPLSTVKNVWEREVQETFVGEQVIWTSYEDPNRITEKTQFVICNYEAVSKITNAVHKNFNPKDTIIIIDECHNYKDIKAQRTTDLLALTDKFGCEDILPMSGTPVKALAVEAIPIFRLLDPYFTPDVEERFKSYSRHPSIMNELLRNRLGMMMFRRLKSEYLDLPPKHELELKIKIPNGKDFTVDVLKAGAEDFRKIRENFYKSNMKKYESAYESCLRIYESTIRTPQDKAAYEKYLEDVKYLRKHEYDFNLADLAKSTNLFENTKILPALPTNRRAEFRDSKSVVKYLKLKILGEVLGSFIGKKRQEMTSALIGKEVIDIINNAEKKTILFSSYTDTIKVAEQKCKAAKLDPVCITGENSKEAVNILNKFKSSNLNPLIASLSVMSTGHTINEANTVIFLNVPFRSVDYEQASDRCYRIGQDTDVYIYKLILDTGTEPNLSTRMHEIIKWSKEQFDDIIGDQEASASMEHFVIGTPFMEIVKSEMEKY